MDGQVRQLLERPEAEEAAAMRLEFGESPLAPPSAARSLGLARSSSGGRPIS